MTRVLGSVLALVATAASAVLFLEIRAGELVPAVPIARRAAPAVQTPAPPDRSEEQLATILERPLFSPLRRPAAASAAVAPGIPRLSGIVIDPGDRRAIFAVLDKPKAVVVKEGGTLGEWSVQSITKDAVTLAKSGETLVLHPGFAPASEEPAHPPPSAATPRQPRVGWVREP